MSKKPETVFEEWFVGKLWLIPDSWWTKIQAGSIRGLPDRIGCIKGRMIALELKTDEGSMTPLQEYTIGKITKAGGFARMVRPSNAKSVLAELHAL